MPIPKPNPDKETEQEFVSRCIKFLKSEDPDRDIKQITAICYQTWRDRNEENIDLKEIQSTTIQTLIFDKDIFKTKDSAVSWAKNHDFKYSNVEETDDSWRLRQRPPEDFKDGSFRTIELDKGVKAVIGKLKSEESMDETQYKRDEDGNFIIAESVPILFNTQINIIKEEENKQGD